MTLLGDGHFWQTAGAGVGGTRVSRQCWALWSTDRSLQAGWGQHLASAELFSSMLSSTFATIPVVPTAFCISNTIWSNTLQRQHVFPVGVAFQSDTVSSARAGTTLPWQVYTSQILHQPWSLMGQSPPDLQCWLQDPNALSPTSFTPTVAFLVGRCLVPGEQCSPCPGLSSVPCSQCPR